MSRLTPTTIYKDFKQNKLDKSKASELLISLMENVKEKESKSRIVIIKLLGLIGSKEKRIFNFLENLLISDLNEYVRGNAGSIIIEIFPHQAYEPIKWALNHEKSENCLNLVIKSLEITDDLKLKSILETIKYVRINGKIYFPSEYHSILYLHNKNVKDLSKIIGLRNLTNLRKLFLDYNQIGEIRGLENLRNLKSLHIQGNRISKIEGLGNLSKLEYLYLNYNEISEIKGLNHLSNLKSLMIYDNQISQIKGLENLENLVILNLRNNKISEIEGLENLRNLKRLDLSNNEIYEIKGLDNLSKLEFLDLSYNKISEFRGLKTLKKLKFLDLRNNKISEIKGLSNLKKLEHLYLGINEILQIENFKKIDQIRILNKMSIEGNNIPSSTVDILYRNESFNNSIYKQPLEFRDIKYLPVSFDFYFLMDEFKHLNDPLEYFTSSLWRIIWKNNEYEIFRLNKFGMTDWVHKSRKRRISK
ncbi:MAG: leucine-rich repeat domain-containing protein [Promethearchaeota archaeon]|jgi:Leucine-rich repeat (LRR) protein